MIRLASFGRRSLFSLLAPLLLVPGRATAQTPDRVAPTARLAGFEPDELPQFVAISFDDNFQVEGVEWANDYFATVLNPAGNGVANNYDGAAARVTFFHNSSYLEWAGVPDAWALGVAAGFEIGNHTVNHPNGRDASFGIAEWNGEIASCTTDLVDGGLGLVAADVVGFRTPFLAYNDATFASLVEQGLVYDSTIGACWADDEDGSNCLFPYTLDRGSPDNAALHEKFAEPEISERPGLWEVPVSTLIVPPDDVAATYGFTPGLRGRIPTDMAGTSYYEPETGKIASLDITLFYDAGMTPEEVQATLEYTFDLRFDGNRAPFVFVAHTHVYASAWDGNVDSTAAERQAAIEGFVAHALERSATRVVAIEDIVEWMRHPLSLTGEEPEPETGTGGMTGSGGANGTGGGSGGSEPSTGGAGGGTEVGGGGGDAGCSCRTTPGPRGGPAPAWLVACGLVALGVALRKRPLRPS